MDSKIFKTYDVRGIYPSQIDEEAAYKTGRAFVSFLNAKEVVVGYDMRESSPSLYKELCRGITDQGARVISIGMCTTPMVSFLVASQKLDGGIMISASHNPGEYNAFKLIAKKAIQLSSETGIKEIKNLVENNTFTAGKKGTVSEINILQKYLTHVAQHSKINKDLKIVIDHGNGVGSITAMPFFENNPNVIHMYHEPDGTFPNHPADPHNIENLQDLQNKVRKTNADIGLFFDGDADRVLVVDENGDVILADLFLALLAQEELKTKKGNVYFDLRFSKAVPTLVKELGGTPIMMRVGNPFYKEKMINEGGIIAGEFSGHIMFEENYGIDDGLFAAIKVLNILSNGEKLSELISPLKRFHGSEEINIKVDDVESVLESIREQYTGEQIELDGVYVQYPNWWFNLRKSNTEPVVRLRLEADTKELLEEKRDELVSAIQPK